MMVDRSNIWFSVFIGIFCLCGIVNGNADEKIYDKCFMKPGAGTLSVQAQLKNYVCKFTYAAQGGTHEEWGISLELSNGGNALICTVARAMSSSSYLYFEHFKMELTGPMIGIAEIDVMSSQRNNENLQPEEYLKESTSISSVAGKFKNKLEKVAVMSPLSRDDL